VANAMAEVKAVGLKLQTGELSRDDPTARDAIMLFVHTLLGLERVQFMGSFGVTFAIAESGMFLPIGQAVKKICADELNIHVEAGKAIILNELQTPEGQASFNRIKSRVQEIYDEIVRSELRWCKYMFSNGRELVGMNLELLENWVLFNANDVYVFTKIENPFKIIRKNPIPFINDWIDLNNHQASPQEEKPSNYLLGGLVNDAGDKVYDFDL
jgi:ribonucleoside-diphosphate reductase beta chain